MTTADASAALFAAAQSGGLDAVRKALEQRAAVDHQDEAGWTALMWAARFNQIEVVRALVTQGASLAVRNGLNQDAVDIADHQRATKVSRLLELEPAYRQGRAALKERARALAKRLVKDYSGRSKEQGMAYVNSDFMVNANYKGMQCLFMVFAGGFSLWIQNFRAGPVALSLNLEGMDNANHPSEHEGWVAWPEEFPELPLYVVREGASEPVLRKFPGSADVRDALRSLALSRFEWLVIVPGQLRLQCKTEDMGEIRARLDAISRIFELTNRPQPAPLLSALAIKYAKRGSPAAHQFGGTTLRPITCPACGELLYRIACISLMDESLFMLKWNSDSIESAVCFGCVVSDTSSLTLVSYEGEPNVIHQSESMGDGDYEPFPERSFALESTRSKLSGSRSKVGGSPSWIQSDETPECTGCSSPMQFLAQFASRSDAMFGADTGAAYVFVCQDCKVVGTVIQSH